MAYVDMYVLPGRRVSVSLVYYHILREALQVCSFNYTGHFQSLNEWDEQQVRLSRFYFKTTITKLSVGSRGKILVMKKLYLLLTLLVAVVCTGKAQSTQVATLSHEGTITSYTSADALRNAYEAAVDGDVITLSSGSFTAINFEKRITVRGAGMGVRVNDTDPYIEPTLLVGNFEINADGDENNNFKLEGILSENSVDLGAVINAQFSKCKFKGLGYNTNRGGFTNVTFINCVFYDSASICFNATMNFYGCYLKNVYFNGSGSHHNITNCILEKNNSFEDYACVVKNSIYINSNDNEYCMNHGNAFNSVWLGKCYATTGNPFYATLESHNNTILPEGMKLFKEGTFYQLTDEAKQYVGDDGTEVGIYGGSLSFDPTPTNPQIVKFNVAPKTTADGKLSVDIEVNAK